MDLSDAKKLAKIAEDAGGGMIYEIQSFVQDLNDNFPTFEWSVDEGSEETDEPIRVHVRRLT